MFCYAACREAALMFCYAACREAALMFCYVACREAGFFSDSGVVRCSRTRGSSLHAAEAVVEADPDSTRRSGRNGSKISTVP
jgi:hypothetical protein